MKNGLCRTRDIPDTIISKEERSQPHNHANHMLWGWERFYMNLQNFVPDTQVDIQLWGVYSKVIGNCGGHKFREATGNWRRLFKGYWGPQGT